jgi:4-hydroxy-2-oxoheptanedioate aldolase
MTTRRFIRPRLRAGECLVGCFVQVPALPVSEVLARCGFDVLIADAEHAPLAPGDIATVMAAAHGAGIAGLVRVATAEPSAVQYALDAGAAGVIVPRVDTAAQAVDVAAITRYPPQGRRGTGPGRASVYGIDRAAGVEEALDGTLVAIQIESAAAITNLDEILDVEGVDMAFVGPNDLSQSLGRPPEDELTAVIDDVLSRAAARGWLTGILAPTSQLAARYRAAGATLLVTGTDLGMLAAGAQAARAAADGTSSAGE